MSEAPTKSPFKFLDSYGKEDKEIFFGRQREVEELFAKVFQSRILLVYGASGTGKSSIINCGLSNKFNEGNWLPIQIRRGGNIRRSMVNQLRKEAASNISLSEQESSTNEGLVKIVNSVFLDHFKPIYLIFDQFEELFIFGFEEEWRDFISSVKHLLETDLDVHFLFVIRGEYLEFLSEFEELIPNFFDNRLRIEKMTRKNALESIQGPCDVFGIDIQEGFEEHLLQKLNPEKSQVELTFLQVVLDKIYRNASTEDGNQLVLEHRHIDQLGQLEDILAEFVDEQLFNMDDPRSGLTILKSLVSLEGTKVQKTIADIQEYTNEIGQGLSLTFIEKIVLEFVNKRILKEKDENERYELRHDSLAQKIYEKITAQEKELLDVRQFLAHSLIEYKKRGTLLNDEDLSYVGVYERKLNLNWDTLNFIAQSQQKSKARLKSKRTRSVIAVAILALLASFIIAFIYSQQQKVRAEELALVANEKTEALAHQRNVAESERQKAQFSAEEAASQASIALSEKIRAERAQALAEDQQQIASEQRRVAQLERQKADFARVQAEQNRNEAIQQKNLAEAHQRTTLMYRMRATAREMALKSALMLDPELKALLAVQAFHFNNTYNGPPYHASIYHALLQANVALELTEKSPSTLHKHAITHIRSNGSSLITCSTDGSMNLIAQDTFVPSQQILQSEELLGQVVETNPGEFLSGTFSGNVVAIKQGKIVHRVKVGDRVVELLPSEEPHSIYAFTLNGMITELDLSGQFIQRKQMEGGIASAIIANQSIWIANRLGELIALDMQLQEKNRFHPQAKEITKLQVSPSFNQLVIGYKDGQVMMWDILTEQPLQVLSGHTAAVTAIQFDKSGAFLATAGFDRQAFLRHTTQLEAEPIRLFDHETWISSLAFSEDYLFTGDYNGVLRRFPLAISDLVAPLCNELSRDMTEEEWSEFVAKDIPYQKTCINE